MGFLLISTLLDHSDEFFGVKVLHHVADGTSSQCCIFFPFRRVARQNSYPRRRIHGDDRSQDLQTHSIFPFNLEQDDVGALDFDILHDRVYITPVPDDEHILRLT